MSQGNRPLSTRPQGNRRRLESRAAAVATLCAIAAAASAAGVLAPAAGAASAAAPAAPAAAALPYPRLMTTVWHDPEKKDFAAVSRFDAVEFSWEDILNTPGYEDSVLAMKARNPALKVIGAVGCDVHCSNWLGREVVMYQWTEQMVANDSLWWLRDVDGDYWKTPSAESTCTQGWMNFTQIPMARAFAEYLYQDMFVEHPGVFDGIHFDQLVEWIAWLNSWPWTAGGVDSIDADRDGIADERDSLNAQWSAGTAAFCTRFRELCGDQYILFVNGSVPESVFPLLNGRFHEGFPGPVGNTPPDWHKSLFDPKVGYLSEQSQYNATPQQMITLHGLSFYPVDCDPLRVSTTEAPNDPDCADPALKLTVASALLGDGYACFTGFGRPSAPPGAAGIYNHTTWWFPLYDTLRTNLGAPIGAAYDSALAFPGQTNTTRHYTGGNVRLTHLAGSALASPAFDLNPKAIFREPPDASPWVAGETRTIPIKSWDPLIPDVFHKVRILLSRNGGASFPETLKVQQGGDSLVVIQVPGPSAADCRVRVEAKDYTGLKGWSDSGPFALLAGAAASLVVSPDSIVVSADTTARFAVAAFDAQGNPTTVSGEWSVNGITGSIDATGLFLPQSVGRGTVRYQAGGLLDSAGVTVVVGAPSAITVLPTSATIPADSSGLFTATVTDANGNARSDAIAWSVAGAIGSVSAGGVFAPSAVGSGGVVAANGALRDTASVTVVAGAAASLVVSPDSIAVSADTTARFTVAAFDAQGNPTAVAGEWSVNGITGSIDATGLFLPQSVGRGTVRYQAGGLLDSAGVTVVVGAPSAITVLPTSATIPADSSGLFTATVTDANGNARSDAIAWSVAGAIGSVSAGGVFAPSALGSGGVVAASGALRDTASVTVVAGAAASLVVSPDSVTLEIGGEATFSATFLDVLGFAVAGGPVEWSVAGPGTLVSAGRVRGTAAGLGVIVARSGALADSAAFRVSESGGETPPREYALDFPSGPLVASPSGRLSALRVEARATRGGVPDSTASADSLRLVIAGGGPCAAETLRATALDGEPGAFAFETPRLGGCGDLSLTFLASDLASPIVDAVALRSPDQDASGAVGMEDVALFLRALHATGDACADLDADGAITANDADPLATELGEGCAAASLAAASLATKASVPAPAFALRFSGERVLDTLRLAPDGWDLVDGTLWCAGDGGLGALYIALRGTGQLVSLGAPPAGGLDARALAADEVTIARCLAFDPGAPVWAPEVAIARLAIALPSGALLDSIVVEATRVDGAYGLASVAALTWEIAAPPPDSTGGEPPDSTGSPDDSSGAPGDSSGSPPDSGGAPPDSGGSPPDSGGAPPDSGGAPDDSSGAPVDSTLGNDPPDSTESPGDSTGGDPPDDPPSPPIGGSPDAPAYRLLPPQPNPARRETNVRYVVPNSAAGPVRISVYDAAGRHVLTLVERAGPGEHEVAWRGVDVRGRRSPPGIYFLRLDAPSYSETQRAVLLE